MLILKDNSTYSSTTDDVEKYFSLLDVANRNVSELIEENGNSLLIYPYSFKDCEDDAGKLQLFSARTSWEKGRCTKINLETGNLVGFIGVRGQSVSIHSRFSQDSEKDYFLHYMLQKVFYINVVNMMHGTSDEPMFDLLMFLFPRFLNEALAQGVYKAYRRNEYNDANIRGVIDINRHIKNNIPFGGRVAYRTCEFGHDNHVTELIRHTIEYIGKSKFGRALLENSAETRADVAQIMSATPSYSRTEREEIIRKNQKIVRHPYFTRYTPLQKLCLRILRHERFKYGQNEDKIYGVLFDVSYLWEEYLATILTKQGFEHPNNRKNIGRIYLADFNKFPRYVDFFRKNGSIVVDAKYKAEIKRDDVHQVITYMYRLKSQYGMFIYPALQEHSIGTYSLLGYGEKDNAKLKAYFFYVPQNTVDYKDFIAEISVSESKFREYMRNFN